MLKMFRDRFPVAADGALGSCVCWQVSDGRCSGAARHVIGVQTLKAWLREFVNRFLSFLDKDGYAEPWKKQCRLTNMNSAGKDGWDIQSHYNLSSGNSTLTSGAHTTS